MRSRTRWMSPWLPGLALAAVVSMGAGSDNGCLGTPGEDGPGFGQAGECAVAADCEQFLPDVDCVGEWACTNTVCAFECGSTNACTSDADCAGGACVDGVCESVVPPQCTDDAACPPDSVCDNGVCVGVGPPGCLTDQDCPVGLMCQASQCVPVTKPPTCASDADCGPGDHCIAGVCIGVKPPIQCNSDADCGPDATCECTPDPNCPVCDVCLFQCVPKVPTGCIETGCSGEICAGETMFTPCVYEPWFECLELTKCGQFAPDGSCGWQKNAAFEQCLKDHAGPKDSCTTDSDCGPGQFCSPGLCPGAPCTPDYCPPCYGTCEDIEPNGMCYGSETCDAGFHCSVEDGDCLPPPGCGPGAPCPAVCAGYCVPDEPLPCSSDADCAPNEYCGCSWDTFAGDAEAPGAAPPCQPQCLPKEEPPLSCQSDADCAPNEYCGCSWGGPAPDGSGGAPAIPCLLECLPKEEPPPNCQSDADCGPNEYCGCSWEAFAPDGSQGDAAFPCVLECLPKEQPPIPCEADSDCAAGQVCQVECPPCACPTPSGDPADPAFAPPCQCEPCGGVCVDAPPEQCSSDADCGKGEFCGCGPFPGMPNALIACWMQCMPIEEPPPECQSDAECGPGQTCDVVCPDCACPIDPTDPAGVPAPCDCGPCYGTCVDLPPQPCGSDVECPAGEICGCGPWTGVDPAGKIACFPQCIPDPTPSTCLEDAQCGAGQFCNTDLCLPPPGCVPGEACDAVCYGQCEDVKPSSCQADADCPKGFACQCAGGPFPANALVACLLQCVPVEPTTGECISDTECGPGAHCNTTDYCLNPPWCKPGTPCPPVCYGLCEQGIPAGACSDTVPCPDGQTCVIEACDGCTCVPGQDCSCADSMQCYGKCSEKPPAYDCSSDADCKDGYYCSLEVCSSCVCADGNPDCPCPGEPICQGKCTEETPQPVYCSDSSECPAGQVCDMAMFAAPAIPCTPESCGDPLPPPPGICVDAPSGECMPSGCSGQVCANEPVTTTCEWQPWYACYKLAKCGAFGPGGACAWSENPEFVQCMADFGTAP